MPDSLRLQVSVSEEEQEEIYKAQEEISEMKYKAWVEYSFVIGAWIFTVSMYLIYFLIINAEVSFLHTCDKHS